MSISSAGKEMTMGQDSQPSSIPAPLGITPFMLPMTTRPVCGYHMETISVKWRSKLSVLLLLCTQHYCIMCITRIITSPRVTGFSNFYQNSNQKSVTLPLEEGEDYLLVAELKEGAGLDYLQVQVAHSFSLPTLSLCPSSLPPSHSSLPYPSL